MTPILNLNDIPLEKSFVIVVMSGVNKPIFYKAESELAWCNEIKNLVNTGTQLRAFVMNPASVRKTVDIQIEIAEK